MSRTEMAKNYYDTLGVAKNSNEKEIRSAYRRLARQHHPDVNPGDSTAEARFKEINEAYQVLSDADSRKKYDRFGENWRHADQMQGGGGPGSGASPFTFFRNASTRRSGSAGFSAFTDVDGLGDFSNLFDGFADAGWGPRPRAARRRLEVPVTITLEEAYAGAARTVLHPSGKRLEVRIPAGVESGARIHVDAAKDGVDEFYLIVTVAPHAVFERAGDDVRFTARVPLLDAVLGGETQAPSLGGKSVAVRVPQGTQNGRVIRLRGKGMPKRGGGHGDMLVTVQAVLPVDLTPEQRELFERLRDAEHSDERAGV
ncbi:MAG: J domain-containing protein [Chloroflexota bacterium]|nr:J domain-containing protein [Chloroflexota bacterium]MDE2884209.1 J domain-containing protein [Chloroflexota bacterium]